jgi:hypothetical protein
MSKELRRKHSKLTRHTIWTDIVVSQTGFPLFANMTFANRIFANGESPGVSWRKYSGLSPIGEFPGMNWRKSTKLSPIVWRESCGLWPILTKG